MLLRGKALRDATVLRLLAVERILRALLLIGIGYAILRFRHSEANFQALFNKALPAAQPLARVLHFDLDHSPTIAKLRHLLHTSPPRCSLVALAVFGYAAINLVEATGLWLGEALGRVLRDRRDQRLPAAGDLRAQRARHGPAGRRVRDQHGRDRLPAAAPSGCSALRGGRAAFEAERHSAVAARGRDGQR